MVLVAVYATKGKDGTWDTDDVEILPVVAIAAKYCDDSQCYYYNAIIHDPAEDGGLMTEEDFTDTVRNSQGVTRLVATPWPAEEDDERLKEIINRLKKRVRELYIRSELPEEIDFASLLGPESSR